LRVQFWPIMAGTRYNEKAKIGRLAARQALFGIDYRKSYAAIAANFGFQLAMSML